MDNHNHDVLTNFKHNTPLEILTVGDDFEERVFSKIKRKKTNRKRIAAALAGIFLLGSIFLAQNIIFQEIPVDDKQVFARQDSIRQESNQLEEIPLTEDVIFTSSDSQNDYAIEQISSSEDIDTI
ncbi:MAG: hypothetical protein L0Y73_07210 [Candidatus Aminicenantes bacterium]|nr:hypothetical protein [Candidatus Aminicenantes bacterium]